MVTNAFAGQATPPTEAGLIVALGAARPLWDQFIADLARGLVAAFTLATTSAQEADRGVGLAKWAAVTDGD